MGQYDNVGDAVLRRPLIDRLRRLGPLHIFVGTRDDNYLRAFGLSDEDFLVRSSKAWRSLMTSSLKSGPLFYAFNAGEIETTRTYAAKYARVLPLLLANRARGGSSVHTGFGVRAPSPWLPIFRGAMRACDVVSWRDAFSAEALRIGDTVPDWAFCEGPEAVPVGTDNRRFLVVAPRRDGQELDERTLRGLAHHAEQSNLELVFAAQIERDGPVCARYAELVGARALVWESSDLLAQETRLRALYRDAAVVVSERLHALVIAATEGAVPVALSDAPSMKAERTMTAAGFEGFAIPLRRLGTPPGNLSLASLAARQTETAAAVDTSRRRLHELTDRISRAYEAVRA
ncbi:polysaccharide pyruvyl transferase family protein [Nocardioides zeae]|uniref:Polysaccharide pyruvyl transferase family protein n=1 Tax=Nocardioides imazamoxiresistens TaxID=3231893 RepID=A0ABU3PWM9_9ACTN|nr:polysaccharide pyruvyl transferase family protein [Nocardioides zeae]MDT9593564.1 polysaccharide pyruvyl transferase family protein [Nocardioides zeae]